MRKQTTILKLSILTLLWAMAFNFVFSNDFEQGKDKLPAIQANHVGKEFLIAIPPPHQENITDNDSIRIFAFSSVNAYVTLEISGKNHKEVKAGKANVPTEFAIPLELGCAWVDGNSPSVPADTVYKGAGIRLYSEYPFVVIVLVDTKNSSESFVPYPSSSQGNDYYVSPYHASSNGKRSFPSLTTIVAAYDNTNIKFIVGGNDSTRTTSGLATGGSRSYTFAKGDVLVVASEGDSSDLCGSHIIGNKPFAVYSGNSSTKIPAGNEGSSYISDAEMPTFTWGLNYYVPTIPNRKYPSIIRVFAREKGNTVISRDGVPIATLTDNSGKQNKSWLEMRLAPMGNTPAPALITADKPIRVALYNTGEQEDDSAHYSTHPFVMNIKPREQFVMQIAAVTPDPVASPIFTHHFVNLLYQTDSSGNIPDDLEIAQSVNGVLNWEKVKAKYPGNGYVMPVDQYGTIFAAKNIRLPAPGTYIIRTDSRITAYAYGYNDVKSYGYELPPAPLIDKENPDTVKPVPSWTVRCDGSVDGQVTDKPDSAAFRSNLAMIIYEKVESYNYNFNYQDFIPGTSTSTTWTLTLIDPAKDAKAVITFTDRRGNDTTITIYYYAFKVAVEPDNIAFGTLQQGKESTKTFTLRNNSTGSAMTVDKLLLKGNTSGFRLEGVTLPFTLNIGETKSFTVKFMNSTSGYYSDSIGVGDTCSVRYLAAVTANVGTTGITDNMEENTVIEVFPNPAGTDGAVAKIATGRDCFATVTIYNSLGQELLRPFSGPLTAGENVIPLQLSSLAPGMYYLTVNTGNSTERVRFIIIN